MRVAFGKSSFAFVTVTLIVMIHIGCGPSIVDQSGKTVFEQGRKEKPQESVLTVIEIEDVYHPVVAGSVQLPFRVGSNSTVVNSGRYAYVTTESHLSVIDVTNPQHPTYITSINFRDEIGKALVSEDRIFVTGDERVHLVDISNPTHPILEFTVSLPNQNAIKDVDIHESHLYVMGANDRLYIFSIGRGTPSLVKAVEMSPRWWLLGLKGEGPEVMQILIPGPKFHRPGLYQPLKDKNGFLEINTRQEIVRSSYDRLGLGNRKTANKSNSDIEIHSAIRYGGSSAEASTLLFDIDYLVDQEVGPLTDFQMSGDFLYVSNANGFFSIFSLVKETHPRFFSTTRLPENHPISISIGKIYAYVLCDLDGSE